ncbi:hypothetical protein E1258_20500 [Micromonospora sp. KC207]|nr:hypothetical protein E1258_20500 [Micromonospora sp. KC207]
MSVSDIPDWPTCDLLAADAAFVARTSDPAPLTLDCDSLPRDIGKHPRLPSGVVALPVLRHWLLKHPGDYGGRDAVWRELVLHARLRGAEWTIAAVGMAMPALVRIAGQLSAGYRGPCRQRGADRVPGGAARPPRPDPASVVHVADHGRVADPGAGCGWPTTRQCRSRTSTT